jgi:general secretion pathway protein J
MAMTAETGITAETTATVTSDHWQRAPCEAPSGFPNDDRTPPNGFTLLEVLVALVVFGCVIVGLVQGLRFGLQAWRAQARETATVEGYEAVERTLRELVAQMEPGHDDAQAPIVGGTSQLRFISQLPMFVDAFSTRQVDATILVDGTQRLVLRWQPYLHAARLRTPSVTVTELAQGVAHLALSYWQKRGGWAAQWRNRDLPALIRIHFVFPRGDRRRWPDIVAAPLLDRQ